MHASVLDFVTQDIVPSNNDKQPTQVQREPQGIEALPELFGGSFYQRYREMRGDWFHACLKVVKTRKTTPWLKIMPRSDSFVTNSTVVSIFPPDIRKSFRPMAEASEVLVKSETELI